VDFAKTIKWNVRDRGHPANWTRENVDYCLAAALKIILQIQHAQFGAHAIPFPYVFEDVLTANTDGVVLNSERGGIYRALSFLRSPRKGVGVLNKGQQVSGHVTPAYESDSSDRWEKTSLETANIFVVSEPKGDSLGEIEPDTDIIVRADLVELSYRVRDNPETRERYPHLFPEAADDNRE
jgi:hypothetical protein